MSEYRTSDKIITITPDFAGTRYCADMVTDAQHCESGARYTVRDSVSAFTTAHCAPHLRALVSRAERAGYRVNKYGIKPAQSAGTA